MGGPRRLDTDFFIDEIEKRPAIWDVKSSEYKDREARRRCWEELTDIFCGSDNDHHERRNVGAELQKRWKNLRDSFAKELKRQKGIPSASRCTTTTYIYFKRLLFLEGSVSQKEGGSAPKRVKAEAEEVLCDGDVYVKEESDTHEHGDVYVKEEFQMQEPELLFHEDAIMPAERNAEESEILCDGDVDVRLPSRDVVSAPPKKKLKLSPRKKYFANILERSLSVRQREDDKQNDGDKLFCLSLFNELKKVPERERLKTKIEMLKVVHHAQTLGNDHHTQPVQHPCLHTHPYLHRSQTQACPQDAHSHPCPCNPGHVAQPQSPRCCVHQTCPSPGAKSSVSDAETSQKTQKQAATFITISS